MQTDFMTHEMHERLWALLSSDEESKDHSDRGPLPLCHLVVAVPPGFALPKDKTITVSVIDGPSKGSLLRLVKPHISIGRMGCGADLEIDDPQVSDMHCAVGVKDSIIRLCDLDSQLGTYVEDQRVSVAPLEHLSEFRVGSSVLLLTVIPALVASQLAIAGQQGKEEE